MAAQNANAYTFGAGYVYQCPQTGSGRYSGTHYHRCYSLAGDFYPHCQNQGNGNIVTLTFVKGDLPAGIKTAIAAGQVEG